MNRLFKKHLRVVALCIATTFAASLIASPAFSRSRRHNFPRNHHGSHHVRVFPDADVLPALLVGGIIAGITFSLIDSAANPPVSEYRMGPRTYAPVVAPDGYAPIVSSDSVMVTAQLLNVRTGPSLGELVIRQLPYGTVLPVCGGSPGWHYVNLPGNQYGWVMIQYTAPLGYPGAG